MRYAGLIKNDLAAAPGVCTTVFVQGCPIHCPGCHNKSSWDFNGGSEFNDDVLEEVLKALHANGIHRTLCIMGGEPFADQNQNGVLYLVATVKHIFPDTPIWVWTGYELKDIIDDTMVSEILEFVDTVVDGPYIEKLRDVTLPHRGSSNQKIWDKVSDNDFKLREET